MVGAELERADLTFSNLAGADLSNADLSYVDFRGAEGLDQHGIKRSPTWCHAFYDADALNGLGLSPDHNEKLVQLQRENDLSQNPNPGHSVLSPCPTDQ